MDRQLENKIALISGGARGIGAAIARRFVAAGGRVGIGDVEMEAADALAAELNTSTESEGDTQPLAVAMHLDVTDPDAWDGAIAKLTGQWGGVDILVNNAGIYERKGLDAIEVADWEAMMAVNAKGPFLGAKAIMAAMKKRGGGSIVNISSTAGIRASVATHYGASKGAVRLMTKSIALHGAPHKVRCNSVHPGPVDTSMGHAAVPEDSREERLGRIPLGRFAAPREIANVVLFLASEESSFVTGTELIVDGGATIA